HYRVIVRRVRPDDCVLAGAGDVDGQPLLAQAAPQERRHLDLVLYDQDPHAVLIFRSSSVDSIVTGLDFGSFRIGFDDRDRRRLHDLWDEVLESGRWTEATLVERFEQTWGAWNGLPAVAFSG